jgi:hypothetical protein
LNGLTDSDRIFCRLLILEESGITFEYLQRKIQTNVAAVADALPHLDIDILKIQEEIEEALALLSRSEARNFSKNQISNL